MGDNLGPNDCLVLVDVQNDLCPGGASPVPDGDAVLPVLNAWIRAARAADLPVVAVRDWHPADHCSFRGHGGDWPPHCVRETPGAAFVAGLELPTEPIVVDKGTVRDRDNVSAFDDTGLAGLLHERGIERIWIGGLAQDTTVYASVIDACEAGFETHLIVAATRPVDHRPGDGQRALEAMRAAGARIDEAA
ncbi:MAG: isochorismatase family protein [Halofilum sp. (in: g-proteobacteria)]|nr:isochorismatase family protein [Halofilum sp. (in: g-proteobacteria)]